MGYWKRSPLSLVGNVTTPTMLLTGEADWRTPMWESEQFYQALKLRKVETALVRIPDASHSIARRPSQLIAKVAATPGRLARRRRARATPESSRGVGVHFPVTAAAAGFLCLIILRES